MRAGQTFLRRMIDLLHSGAHRTQPKGPTPIRLNTGFRADLAWWQCFAQSWNGRSFLPTPQLLPVHSIAPHASGQWACGAWSRNMWFQVQWNSTTFELPIAVKELLPILIAGIVWGPSWYGHRVECLCDNQVVVAFLCSCTSRHKGLMHLLCNLLYIVSGFTSIPSSLTRTPTTWPTIFHVTVFSLSSLRYPRPLVLRHQCHQDSWTSCWILKQTGPLGNGAIGSELL